MDSRKSIEAHALISIYRIFTT